MFSLSLLIDKIHYQTYQTPYVRKKGCLLPWWYHRKCLASPELYDPLPAQPEQTLPSEDTIPPQTNLYFGICSKVNIKSK